MLFHDKHPRRLLDALGLEFGCQAGVKDMPTRLPRESMTITSAVPAAIQRPSPF